jgi:hypothetical protein
MSLQGVFSGQGVSVSANIGAKFFSAPHNKENTMLPRFAAALIATSLVASSALAAQSPGPSGATPAAQTGQTANPVKTNLGKTNLGKSATTDGKTSARACAQAPRERQEPHAPRTA